MDRLESAVHGCPPERREDRHGAHSPHRPRVACTGRLEGSKGIKGGIPWGQLRPLILFSLALAILASVGVLRTRPAAAASGDTLITFTALLNGAQQSPPVDSPSTGVALVLYDKTASLICWRLSFTPLAAPEILAHFHGPGAPGVNAPILINISPSPAPLGSPARLRPHHQGRRQVAQQGAALHQRPLDGGAQRRDPRSGSADERVVQGGHDARVAVGRVLELGSLRSARMVLA